MNKEHIANVVAWGFFGAGMIIMLGFLVAILPQ